MGANWMLPKICGCYDTHGTHALHPLLGVQCKSGKLGQGLQDVQLHSHFLHRRVYFQSNTLVLTLGWTKAIKENMGYVV